MEFVIARNPDQNSTLPYLVRVPLDPPVVLKARDTWPRTAKIYCHPSDDWPTEPDIVERTPVRSCRRRGAAIDLVLDRGRENRSQFVFARARGRDVIFWQSARTNKKARPNVSLPTARASGHTLDILVDNRERYAWKFAKQQAATTTRRLPIGDYAVEHDRVIVAAVERKSLPDLVSTITSGKLRFLLSELAETPRAAVVVEDRYSSVFKLDFVRPSTIAEALGESAVRFPNVPIHFMETRPLAEEWTYRFLGAALAEAHAESAAADKTAQLPVATRPVPPAEPTTAEVRAWALAAGFAVSDRGRLRPDVWDAWRTAHGRT